MALYTNGVLQSVNAGVTTPLSAVNDLYSYIGHSLYDGDPFGDMTLNEFRIYNGALSPNDVAATQVLGADAVLTTNVSLTATSAGANVVLAWPVAAGAFNLQSKGSLTGGTWTNVSAPAAQIVGTQWQVSVPKTGGARFFRLVR